MADDFFSLLLLMVVCAGVSAPSGYRLVNAARWQRDKTDRPSVDYVLAMFALFVGPIWAVWAEFEGFDLRGPLIVSLGGGAWVIWKSMDNWVSFAQRNSIPAAYQKAKVSAAVGIPAILAVTLSWMATVELPAVTLPTEGRPALNVANLELRNLQNGQRPVLRFSANVYHIPKWARVSVDIYKVGALAPVFSETRESRSANNRVGKTPAGDYDDISVQLRKTLSGLEVGEKYYGIWSREETDPDGRRVIYRPIRTPPVRAS